MQLSQDDVGVCQVVLAEEALVLLCGQHVLCARSARCVSDFWLDKLMPGCCELAIKAFDVFEWFLRRRLYRERRSVVRVSSEADESLFC